MINKRDERFKETNDKQIGQEGWKKYARNKQEDEVAKFYKLLPVKFSMGIKQVQITEV